MPIGDIKNKVSRSDVDKIKSKRNTEYEAGFSPLDLDFSDIFEDDDDDKPSGKKENFGSDSSSFGDTGIRPIGGQTGPFGRPMGGMGSPMGGQMGGPMGPGSPFSRPLGRPMGGQMGKPFSPFGGQYHDQYNQGQNRKEPKKKDLWDNLFDAFSKFLETTFSIIPETFKVASKLDHDDLAVFSKNSVITGVIISGFSMLLFLFGVIGGANINKIGALAGNVVVGGMLVLGTGLISIGASAIWSVSSRRRMDAMPDNVGLTSDFMLDGESSNEVEYDEESFDEYFSDVFDDDEDDESSTGSSMASKEIDSMIANLKDIPSKGSQESGSEFKLENIRENVPLNRITLFDTFKPLFPLNTGDFDMRREITDSDEEFYDIETIALKALAAAGRCEMDDLDSNLETLIETFFSYELRLKRVKGLNKLEDISREMAAYFRESSEDVSVSATVDLEGDFYKITISKGVNAIVTLGDTFTTDRVCNFFKNYKVTLPVVAGITEIGEALLVDMRDCNTVLIAGRQRSGKSWYLLSLLISLMSFNTPDDVCMLIIDPKESKLFNTLSLMPHVCGLHSDDNILNILRDVIEKEGARRKRLLANHKCDDIWELRERVNIKLPILYIVIDEVMTVISNLGENSNELFSLLKVIVSQLPSTGIRLIMVPHRAQGVVDKTIRTLIDYTVAVMAETEVIRETLDVKKWDRPLVNKGDAALKIQSLGKERFIKGLAVTTSNYDNSELIINIAKSFYKMGVDIPDMSTLGCGYNRDEDKIKRELTNKNSLRIQYNFDDEDETELDNMPF